MEKIYFYSYWSYISKCPHLILFVLDDNMAADDVISSYMLSDEDDSSFKLIICREYYKQAFLQKGRSFVKVSS